MLGYGSLASAARNGRAYRESQDKEAQHHHLDRLSFHLVLSLNRYDADLGL